MINYHNTTTKTDQSHDKLDAEPRDTERLHHVKRILSNACRESKSKFHLLLVDLFFVGRGGGTITELHCTETWVDIGYVLSDPKGYALQNVADIIGGSPR